MYYTWNSVPVSLQTYRISIISTGRLLLFREIIAVLWESMKHINTLWEKCSSWMTDQMVHKVTHCVIVTCGLVHWRWSGMVWLDHVWGYQETNETGRSYEQATAIENNVPSRVGGAAPSSGHRGGESCLGRTWGKCYKPVSGYQIIIIIILITTIIIISSSSSGCFYFYVGCLATKPLHLFLSSKRFPCSVYSDAVPSVWHLLWNIPVLISVFMLGVFL